MFAVDSRGALAYAESASYCSLTRTSVIHRSLLVAASLLLLLVASAPASAQSRDLWVPRVTESSGIDAAEFEAVFQEILSGTDGDQLVGLEDVEAAIETHGIVLPRCLEGLDVCGSPEEAAAAALGVDRIIIAVAYDEGRQIAMRVRDVEMGRDSDVTAVGEGVREAVYAAIAEVTGLTGTLSVTTRPEGANVYVDDRLLGVTPFSSTLSIGAYELRLELDAYADYGQNIEIRAGEDRRVQVDLQREAADVIFRSNAPGAEVFVDGERFGQPVDEALPLDPGEREVVVRAPGYIDAELTLLLQAGEEREVTLTMFRTPEALAAERRAAILSRPITVELSMVGHHVRTDWEGARVRTGGDRLETRCLLSGVTGGCRGNAPVGLLGLEANLIYNWRWTELELFGLSGQRVRLRGDDRRYALDDPLEAVDAQNGTAWGVHLPHVGGRWMITPAWELYGRTGPTVVVHRVPATRVSTDAETRMRRTSVVWDIRLGTRFSFTEQWFAVGALELGFDTNNGDSGVRVGGTLGIGVRFADPFRIDDRLDRRFRRGSAPDGMEEL